MSKTLIFWFLLLFFLILSVILWVFGVFMTKREEKNVLKYGKVIYSEILFKDIEEMKKVGNLRLYSKRIEKNLFVITTSQILEEYTDEEFVSYASVKPEILKSITTSLREFLNDIPEVNYKSMIKRIGSQIRIDCKQIKVDTVDSVKGKETLRIYCDWGECLWCDCGAYLPQNWKMDSKFMDLYERMCRVYESLFVWEEGVPRYCGFKNEEHKKEIMILFDDFSEAVNRLNKDEYEIINLLDINNI